ncbi:hypothetical protein ACHAQH_009925 [Verticillium albo-atrum]
MARFIISDTGLAPDPVPLRMLEKRSCYLRETRCDLCRFPLVDGDLFVPRRYTLSQPVTTPHPWLTNISEHPVTAKLDEPAESTPPDDTLVSRKLTPYGEYVFQKDEIMDVGKKAQKAVLHMCAPVGPRLGTNVVEAFHAACYERFATLINPDFLAQVACDYFAFAPTLEEDRRRFQYVKDSLACNLHDSDLFDDLPRPLILPHEPWCAISSHLVRDATALQALEHVHRPLTYEAPGQTTLDLRQPIYASFIKIDGLRYIGRLTHTSSADAEGKTYLLLASVPENMLRRKLMLVAHDHRGLRMLVIISKNKFDAWCKTAPTMPGAWWSVQMGHTQTVPTELVVCHDIPNYYNARAAAAELVVALRALAEAEAAGKPALTESAAFREAASAAKATLCAARTEERAIAAAEEEAKEAAAPAANTTNNKEEEAEAVVITTTTITLATNRPLYPR